MPKTPRLNRSPLKPTLVFPLLSPSLPRAILTSLHRFLTVLEGALRYPSETGGWQLGDLDFSEYLDRFRNQRLVIIIAPVGQAQAETYTCGICGFVYNEYGECPRCKVACEKEGRADDVFNVRWIKGE